MKKTLLLLEYMVEYGCIEKTDARFLIEDSSCTTRIKHLIKHGVDIQELGNLYVFKGFNYPLYITRKGRIISNYNNKRKLYGAFYRPSSWINRVIYKISKKLGLA